MKLKHLFSFSCDYMAFDPVNALSNDPYTFVLPAQKGNAVYKLNHALLTLRLKMTKKNGDALDKKSMTAVRFLKLYFLRLK